MNIYFRLQPELLYFKSLIENERMIVKEKRGRTNSLLQINQLSDEQLLTYFIDVYLSFRLENKIREIIYETYYYTNETEIDRILEWTNWLLQENTFIEEQFTAQSLVDYLYRLVSNQLKQLGPTRAHIYFDTFVLFQFKSFHKHLIDIVGYAIDEMKREEEYQYFVQTARTFIQQRAPQTSLLHIVQGENFCFYDHLGKEIPKAELIARMKEKPLYLFGLDEREFNLAPVLSLLPNRIEIYGTDENDGKVITLRAIYEERSHFYPLTMFPFPLSDKE